MKAGGGEGRAMLRLGPFWERRFQEFPRVGRGTQDKNRWPHMLRGYHTIVLQHIRRRPPCRVSPTSFNAKTLESCPLELDREKRTTMVAMESRKLFREVAIDGFLQHSDALTHVLRRPIVLSYCCVFGLSHGRCCSPGNSREIVTCNFASSISVLERSCSLSRS